MNVPHEVLIYTSNGSPSEAVDKALITQELWTARDKTLRLFIEIKSNLVEGMNEIQARKLALEIAFDFGIKKHWHQPYIRFGSGTALSFHDPLKSENILRSDEPFYIDLGPVWKSENSNLEYEGDYGDTLVLGENKEAQKCINFTHTLFSEAKEKWLTEKYTGTEIYQFIHKNAEQAGYKIMEDFDGHRISDFPHHKYTNERLAQTTFTPSPSFWILELQVNDLQNRFGAFFEDIL